VQLANFTVTNDPTNMAWAYLREAQAGALRLPDTDMAGTIDIGDPHTTPPRHKQEGGRPLPLIAKARVYWVAGDFSGPMFEKAAPEGSALRVYFSHALTGLVAHDRPVQSLELAGADGKFYPAAGKIDRGTLVVAAREVPQPVAVRYAWSNAP